MANQDLQKGKRLQITSKGTSRLRHRSTFLSALCAVAWCCALRTCWSVYGCAYSYHSLPHVSRLHNRRPIEFFFFYCCPFSHVHGIRRPETGLFPLFSAGWNLIACVFGGYERKAIRRARKMNRESCLRLLSFFFFCTLTHLLHTCAHCLRVMDRVALTTSTSKQSKSTCARYGSKLLYVERREAEDATGDGQAKERREYLYISQTLPSPFFPSLAKITLSFSSITFTNVTFVLSTLALLFQSLKPNTFYRNACLGVMIVSVFAARSSVFFFFFNFS